MNQREIIPMTKFIDYNWMSTITLLRTYLPTYGLLSTKSYKARVPIRKLPMILPLLIVLRLFVMHPLFTRSIMPPANISEWIPRSL